MMEEIVLEAAHLSKVFRSGKQDVEAVEDVSFQLRQGEALGIVGESGSGKSTVARMLARLTDSSGGCIRLFGKEITHARGKELRDVYRKLQLVFQTPGESFDPRRTLGDGIREGLRNQGLSRSAAALRAGELLKRCGLGKEYAGRYPHQVSGGECQRAAVARALGMEPRILICDEITSALDVTAQKKILELLLTLKQEEKLSFVFISHDLALVQAFCDRVLVLYQGKVMEEGTTEKVIGSPSSEYTRRLVASAL